MKFIAAAKEIADGAEHRAESAEYHANQKYSQKLYLRNWFNRKAERGVQIGVFDEQTCQKQRGENEWEHDAEFFCDVMMLVVSQFVTKHRLDFLRTELGNQRVIQHDSLGLSESRKIGVGMFAAFGSVHHEKSACLEPSLRERVGQKRFQFAVFQRSEFVEQRGDERGINERHGKTEHNVNAAKQKPPPVVPMFQNHNHGEQKRNHKQRTYEQSFQLVYNPQAQSHRAESESLFNDKFAVQAEGQEYDCFGKTAQHGEQECDEE